MGFEVACASCGGRMMVEHPGSIVACPHCDEQLQSPEDASTEFELKDLSLDEPIDSKTDESIDSGSEESSLSFPGLPADPFDPDSRPPDHSSIRDLSSEAKGTPIEMPSVEETDSEPSESGTDNSQLQEAVRLLPSKTQTVSRSKYVLVTSYASAVTIAFVLFLVTTLWFASPHQLESLPDVVPKERTTGEIERIVVSESAEMPQGHTLRLGQSQRFGNVSVTPFKVTRGPLEFVHHDGGFAESKEPTDPVLKLWIRFENVSEDQVFAPLGADLVFYRGPTKRYPEKMRANNFVCRVDEKHEGGHHVLMYDHVIDDLWDLKGQNIERGLNSGEKLVTYIPSVEEGIDNLKGPLVWRVHLRKGLNPKTGWGVTTLIEVEFHSDDIAEETTE